MTVSGKNFVHLQGVLGDDPQVRFTTGGKAVCDLRLATTETFTDRNGEDCAITAWHKVVAWDKLAEQVTDLRKGASLDVKGRLKYESYNDKEGVKKYVTKITANAIDAAPKEEFAQPKPKAGGQAQTSPEPSVSDSIGDEIPF